MDTLLIDDTCVLCNKTVAFIVARGGADEFSFISIYGDEGKEKLKEAGLPDGYDKSIVLIRQNKVYLKSSAALQIAKKMKGVYPLLFMFVIIPKPMRDWGYDLLAKHRHKLF